jgi:aspartate/methionine/tyrosine aminotransferase
LLRLRAPCCHHMRVGWLMGDSHAIALCVQLATATKPYVRKKVIPSTPSALPTGSVAQLREPRACLLCVFCVSQGRSSVLCAGLAEYVRSGSWAAQLIRARALYTEKMEVLCDSLQEHCAEWVEFERPAGGFYLWLRMREAGMSAAAVEAAAMDEGLVTRDGSMYFQYTPVYDTPVTQIAADAATGDATVTAAGGAQHIRLCFSQPSLADLRASGMRLAAACRRVRAQRQ